MRKMIVLTYIAVILLCSCRESKYYYLSVNYKGKQGMIHAKPDCENCDAVMLVLSREKAEGWGDGGEYLMCGKCLTESDMHYLGSGRFIE